MNIQELLNESAKLWVAGQPDSAERQQVHTMIRLLRTNQPKCFGEDDCSSNKLSTCPWRIDCG